MTAPTVQAGYDTLDTVAAQFGQRAEASAGLREQVLRGVAALEDGGWEGRGATAFFTEMNGEILPALQRLEAALNEARAVTLEASTVLRAGEEEGAALFDNTGPSIAIGGGVNAAKDSAGQQEPSRLEKIAEWTGAHDTAISQGTNVVIELVKKITEKEYQPKHAADGRVRFKPSLKGGAHAAKEFPGKWLLKPFFEGARGAKVIPFLGPIVDTGLNFFEFGWGENKDKGLTSREFVTATVADVSAGIAFAGIGAAVGSVVPGPGTVIGFAVGAGLGLAYSKWGQGRWRNTVDQAAQGVGKAATVIKGAWNNLFD